MECERRFTWLPWSKSRVWRATTHSTRYTTTTTNSAVSHQSPPPLSHVHRHSLSFKDVETLLKPPQEPPSSSPRQLKHSLSSPSSSPLSLKDLHTLFYTPKPSIFHRVRAWAHTHTRTQTHTHIEPPDSQNKVVIYYTSLRVVRRTFEDCRAVRLILKAYRVKMDERDLSMNGAYVEELQGIFGKKGEFISLPKVFVNGKLVGGAEEIRRLHESGDLKRMMQRLPSAELGLCGVCGGYQFLVCHHCYGSHKVYDDKAGFKVLCSTCNENGLIKCSSCTSMLF